MVYIGKMTVLISLHILVRGFAKEIVVISSKLIAVSIFSLETAKLSLPEDLKTKKGINAKYRNYEWAKCCFVERKSLGGNTAQGK